MKSSILIYLFLFLLSIAGPVTADSIKYVNATEFQIIGKGFTNTKNAYDRLPASLEGKTRPAVWSLSKNCSGLAVRFRTNSPVIAARWEVTSDVTMYHFAPTGIKGVDLYGLRNGEWQFISSGGPREKITTAVLVDHMDGTYREYMLYLPLYDGLEKLEIGVGEKAEIGNPLVDSPQKSKPVVFYGTSITQGGCASRTGMSYTSQLSRKLNRQVINLGFSGNGQLDLEIAEVMADIDASCFVIDCLPNSSIEQINEKYEPFLEIIRKKNPDTPILTC